MMEHRLIERMISLMRRALIQIEDVQRVDPLFIDGAVDFIHTYADRTHHGKEEDILFRELDRRALSPEDRRIMEELVEEHREGRRLTRALVSANTRYRDGDPSALADITDNLRTLADFYPKHIEKEDKVFFPASRAYLTADEEQAMLAEFKEFDAKMIHEKYQSVVDTWAAT